MLPLRRRLKELGIRPRKSLGQHFAVDPRVLHRMVESAAAGPDDVVVEIGAGLGSLTIPLAQKVQKVYALEIDPRLADALREQVAGDERIEVVGADALQFSFAPLFERWRRKMKLVANLPYEISSPMIFRLFKERAFFSLFVVMLQMEVARRIVARPGTKDYGPLGIWSQVYTRASILFSVPPRAFHPPPKVESAVVRLEVLPQSLLQVDEGVLRKVIRSAFTYRRKTLAKALQTGAFSHFAASQIQEALQSAGIPSLARGESLTLEQFQDLSRALAALEQKAFTTEAQRTHRH